MRRVDELEFAYPAALFRGDGSGVAAILRDRRIQDGSCWARVTSPGAGITADFIHLERRSGGVVDGVLISEDQVAAVAGGADARPPRRIDLDARLTSLGAFTEVADAVYAEGADIADGAALRAARAAIDVASFHALGWMDGRSWRVRVGPTLAGGTTLECHADDGELRLLNTDAARELLERARVEPVIVAASYRGRGRFGGRRTRTAQVRLRPEQVT